ncbi:unnamed protein product [Rotaria magnacalcarata]|nr:unnamed protein product [Rotaria magnacalcarata]CAF3750313.1 unnamed protein product [Rotaria magnacalcarata]CAF3752456.1 unnamed protein product [Rotaria magnacalcarata]CAF3876278.1 unnamed protein product [Rotaria magnacalcarata]
MLLISSSVLTETRMCQCQCCRYIEPLYPNNKNSCACTVIDQEKTFTSGSSTDLFSARKLKNRMPRAGIEPASSGPQPDVLPLYYRGEDSAVEIPSYCSFIL